MVIFTPKDVYNLLYIVHLENILHFIVYQKVSRW